MAAPKLEGRVLLVDDDEDIQTAGRLLLGRHLEQVVCCSRPDELLGHLAASGAARFDVLLLDMNYGGGETSGREGLAWLERVRAQDPELVVIAVTAYGNVDLAVEAMKRGATDFVTKPWQNERLLATVRAAVELRRSREAAPEPRRAEPAADPPVLHRSPAMAAILDVVARAAPTDANVLLLGENGAGKEVIAREIHRQSSRRDEALVSVDLGSISEALFESELFGHRKGAFTDAREDRLGRLQAAHRGTLFLDEIGNLPLRLQAKLLTVLEQRVVTPLGETRPVAFDVRVIAATNLGPAQLGDDARFRRDLLYRLNTVTITVPPLRDRREDVALLAEHFIGLYARKYRRQVTGISPAGLALLEAYGWPGNVRELRHAIERAVILSAGGPLGPADFHLQAPAGADAEPDAGGATLEEVEKAAIARALRRHKWNVSHTAKELGITRTSLYRRMEKYGL